MAPTTYFGRPEQEGRHLGADFDLIAKWSRSFHLRHPVHSYYLTQLSDNDRSKLFTGPAEEFRLEQGTDDTVKLETVKDEVDRIDPDVQAMMRSSGYIRSEARLFEVLNAVEDAQDEAQGAAALALSKALMAGVDGPKAEKLAKEAADKTLSSAARKVKAHWKTANRDRLEHVATKTEPGIIPSKVSPAEMRSPSPVGPDFVARWNATLRERFPALAAHLASQEPAAVVLKDVHSEKTNSTVAGAATASLHPAADTDDDQTTPQQKHPAKFSSPNVSVPEYGSETSSDSVQWNSPMYPAGELPSSPDVDSVVGFSDETEGGVALLPTSLVGQLMLQDEPDVVIPTPAPATVDFSPPHLGGHLGAGLREAAFVLPSGINVVNAGNPFHNTFNAAACSANVDQFAPPGTFKHTVIKPNTTIDGASKPFSPNSKNCKYPLAKERPWMGFTCYEVDMKFGHDQLVPKYWTTTRGKERYLRHKIGELKLDDAKIRSDRFSGAVARNPVHVFVDLSNIIIGFYDSMKESRGIPVTKRVMAPMFSFKNFDTILTRDRNVAKRIVAGSMSNSYNKRWPSYMIQAQELLYEMNILERVPKPSSPVRKRKAKAGTREAETLASGADTSGDDGFVGSMKNGEQGVDELLHLKMLQSAIDTPSPATMVLATGDAAYAQYSDGFKKNIERALTLGWHIELYAWSRNISSAWREPGFAEQWGHQFKIVELDGFCEELFDMTIESLEH